MLVSAILMDSNILLQAFKGLQTLIYIYNNLFLVCFVTVILVH